MTGSSAVNVTVETADPGDSMIIDVAPMGVEHHDVTFDAVSVNNERGGDFTMDVLPSREPAGYASRTRSTSRTSARSSSLRVSKSRLREADMDPETVVLYRFADDEWTGLPTEVVNETVTHYLMLAESPGFSEFAVRTKRPSFETRWAVVDRSRFGLGEEIGVATLISNIGGADSTVGVELVVGERVVADRRLTIAACGTRQVTFRAPMASAGTHRVLVDGGYAGVLHHCGTTTPGGRRVPVGRERPPGSDQALP